MAVDENEYVTGVHTTEMHTAPKQQHRCHLIYNQSTYSSFNTSKVIQGRRGAFKDNLMN